MTRADRFSGCMLGLAVGDALGYPVEGWTGEQIRSRYGRIEDYVEPPTEPPERWRLPGLHSDDTQQALIVAEALIEAGRADPDLICQKMLEMAEGPPHLALGAHRGAGRNFRYKIQALRDGAPWNRGSRHTAGVGASMRVAPVGLAFGIDDAAVRANTTTQALITHNDPRAVAAAFMVAHTVGTLAWLPPRALDPEALLLDTINFVRRSETWLIETYGDSLARDSRPVLHHMSEALQGISGQTGMRPEAVLPGIAERASQLAGYTIEHPCRGFAPAGVVSAFYFFLHYRGEFEAALTEAINAGGDADTVGAIVGALCGTYGGPGAIPGRWSDGLHGRDLVLSRARALAGTASAIEAAPSMCEVELRWTLEEDRVRREKTGQTPVDSSGWVRQEIVRRIPPTLERHDRQETDGREAYGSRGGRSGSSERRGYSRDGGGRGGDRGDRSRRPRGRRPRDRREDSRERSETE